MKTFLSCLLVVLLAAVVVAGWFVWEENQRLQKDLQALRSQLVQITEERDRGQVALREMTVAKESLGRNLVTTMKTLDETKASLTGLREDKRRVDAELAEERRMAREKAEAEARAAVERAAAEERAAKAEAERRRAEDPLADVGTLKQLLDLTDKAPRRSAD